MLLSLVLPLINEQMTTAEVVAIHVQPGESLAPGAKLIDVRVDLGSNVVHDCPPISDYRIASREAVWLRRLDVAGGDSLTPGAAMALFSTDPDEPLDGAAARSVRVSVAGMLFQMTLWSEDH